MPENGKIGNYTNTEIKQMANIFQQAKQAMELRGKMKQIQKELESQTADYENAGVAVTVRGDMFVSSVKIRPDAFDPSRIDKLERTIVENTNRAMAKVKEQASQYMMKRQKELGLDGLMGG